MMLNREKFWVHACLAKINGIDGSYRLDFKLNGNDSIGTFVLLPTSSVLAGLSDMRIGHLAETWIDTCISEHTKCGGARSSIIGKPWYPTRLIELGKWGDVKLVSTRGRAPDESQIEGYYVTLSHRWGKAKFKCLAKDNLSEFQRGISLESLPRTFRDAIRFSRGLYKVQYIWIDSLCIMQGDKEDWINESAEMYKVYNNSYCNLSATAAEDSEQGLFLDRKSHWECEFNLNVSSIPGRIVSDPLVEPCRVQDVMFWERDVDNAPVNTRGWVLQERLMAPRVLHFCRDQVAWECNELEASENFPHGIPKFRLRFGDIVHKPGFKRVMAAQYPFSDSAGDEHQPSESYSERERWKEIVRVYSKMQLTDPGDKVIALSGIAKVMSERIGDTYIVGMWKKDLASQLLWYVNPVWENGRFSHPSKRPGLYRAPSFSWLAVDAEQGVIPGDSRDEGLLFQIIEIDIRLSTDNEFGLVEDGGHLKVVGYLKKIQMAEYIINGVSRFRWYLKRDYSSPTFSLVTFSLVYLDSPADDRGILGPDGRLYCLPALKNREGYTVCLLLQRSKGEPSKFSRVGLTKIPPYEDTRTLSMLSGDEELYADWDATTEQHSIYVV
ncbi:uncharacterized protein PAC_08072 [Phialocephala subalpina]|uniref:Heterokaryon incompatibility domain-containing protein n=1 Tax=Phialocephala subalpina TaxID=576137 RepID=A0A1L7WZJ9_9HELO|nr:uncharacterized protein PAC_08072 [Phialocephala subalpina]